VDPTQIEEWPLTYQQQINSQLQRKKPLKKGKPPERKTPLKPNKYHAKAKPPPLGETLGFDSGGERDRYLLLQLLEKAGEITDLKRQQRVFLTRANISYRSDATYIENGQLIYEDFKGLTGKRFAIIKKLWSVYGPAPLRIVHRGHGNGFIITEEIKGGMQ